MVTTTPEPVEVATGPDKCGLPGPAVLPEPGAVPVTVVHDEVTYGPSAFGVFTPTRIVSSFFDRTGNKKAPGELRLVARITFTYDAFKRFEVTTDTDIQLPKAP